MLESKSSHSSVLRSQLFISSSKQNVSHPCYKQTKSITGKSTRAELSSNESIWFTLG